MSRLPAGTLPNTDFTQTPIWWEDAPPVDEPAPATPATCDVLIVGGGFAGLATALELARGGARVAVFEADAFGLNASARNSGGVSFGLDLAGVARWRRWSGARGPSVPELARGALDSLTHMQQFISDNGIECDFHLHGRLSLAPTPKHYDVLSRRVDSTNRLFDAGAYMVGRADQHAEIGSDRFHGAMVIPRSAQLHPARYLQGLLGLCRRAGVMLFDRSAVQRVDRASSGGFEVFTEKARVRTRIVVIATNAHAARLADTGLQKRIVPVASHIIVTEALPPDLAAQLIPKRRTGADSRRLLAYFRRTPDGSRFLYGSRAVSLAASPQRCASVLYRRMVASFPQLDGVRIGHAWGCKVAFTLDRLPHLGEIKGVHYIAGCNGNGVAMMNFLGHHLARKILGGAMKAECVFDQSHFPGLPLYTGKPWFLPIVASAYGALDRFDDVRA